MRFYSEIRTEPQKHLEEICENPCLVFSTDFFYYLTEVQNIDWHPNKLMPCPYQPHPLSPCTKNVKTAMRKVLDRSALSYELIYEELVPADADNKLELFTDRAKDILNKLTDNPLDAFFTLLHLGRWTIIFYKNGTKEAVHLAPYLMANALKKIIANQSIRKWFRKFSVIAEDISEVLTSIEGFAEEYYCYFEELDSGAGDCDECSLWICRHGKNLIEHCMECDEYDYDERSLRVCKHGKDMFEDCVECEKSDEYDGGNLGLCEHDKNMFEDCVECEEAEYDDNDDRSICVCKHGKDMFEDCEKCETKTDENNERGNSDTESGEFLEVIEDETDEENRDGDYWF